MHLRIIIVNFNSGTHLLNCVNSIQNSVMRPEIEYEILVIDNASTDDSYSNLLNSDPSAWLRGWKYYPPNTQNLGFAKAVNQAFQNSHSDYFLVINPDCVLNPDTIDGMIEFMKNTPMASLATCRVENMNGTFQKTCCREFPRPSNLIRFYIREPCSIRTIPALSGCFMLGRYSSFDSPKLLNESYFLFGEDLDLCMRLLNNGKRVFYVPSFSVRHLGAVSQRTNKIKSIIHGYVSMRKFQKTYFWPKSVFLKSLYEVFWFTTYFMIRGVVRSFTFNFRWFFILFSA